jgi:hypothetical protein
MQHRIFLHSDFGEWLVVERHGEVLISQSGLVVSTRDLFRDHQVEDLGRVVTLAEWLREINIDYWSRRRKPPRQLEHVKESPAEGLAALWGGVPDDYLRLIEFFDKPCEFVPDNPDAASLITHNSFGIFLAEELMGTVITLTTKDNSQRRRQIISTRAAAEDLVYARIGSIPPAGHLAARISLKPWMYGTEVSAALITRRINERAAVGRKQHSQVN